MYCMYIHIYFHSKPLPIYEPGALAVCHPSLEQRAGADQPRRPEYLRVQDPAYCEPRTPGPIRYLPKHVLF